MNTREKINLIDNDTNKECVTDAIVNNIFTQHGVDYTEKNNGFLYTWLHDNIMSDSLADILLNEQKVYVIKLAKKVASDICYNEDVENMDDFKDALNHYGQIGIFVSSVFLDEFLTPNPTEFFNDVHETATLVGYGDTLIVDDTMYVYDNGSEERILVKVGFSIEYHKNYTCKNIARRIKNRLHYCWDTEIKSLNVSKDEDGAFFAEVHFFTPKSFRSVLSELLKDRFGATSGNPWYRCKIGEIEVE